MDTVPQTISFSKAWEAFELAARVEGRSHKTLVAYRYVLGSFQRWLGEQQLCHVDAGLLRTYLTHLQERLRPASVHHHFRWLHAFLSFLHREGLLSPNPIAQIRAPKLGEHFPEVFAEEEVHRLLAAPDRHTFEGFRNYAMMLTFLDTGMRLGELIGLEISNANLAGRSFRVRGKGGKERLVFMGRKLTRAIYEWLRRRGHQPYSDVLFCTRHGDSLKSRNVNRILERIAKRVKVTGRWNPHKFRHTFGHRYILAGGGPFSLRDLMGHSTVTVTMLYVRMAGTPHLREQHARYSPVDRLQGSQDHVVMRLFTSRAARQSAEALSCKVAERVKAGMARAKKQGVAVGRPRVINKDGIAAKWLKVRPLLLNGTMSQREAAKVLGVGRATISRLLAQKGVGSDDSGNR